MQSIEPQKQLLAYIERVVALNDVEVQLFLSKTQIEHFEAKSFLLKAGKVCRTQYFIVKGCIRTYYVDENAVEHIVQFGMENWWAADLQSFITQQPANFNLQALEPTAVLALSHQDLQGLFEEIPKLERLFRIIIQNAYVSAQQRIVENISATAEARYESFLQRYPGLDQRVPQYMIAGYIGVTPQFFSKMKSGMLKQL